MKTKRWCITEAPIDEAFITSERSDNMTMQFRILDDDEEVYFIGFMIPTSTEALFAPLDAFGVGWGCTDIQILEKGQWESV